MSDDKNRLFFPESRSGDCFFLVLPGFFILIARKAVFLFGILGKALYFRVSFLNLKQIVMQELVKKINEQIAAFQENANLQVEKNNKAAGTRARKAALELTKLLKDFRKVSVEEAKK